MAMLECIMFKTAPLEFEEEMQILFNSICVTNATSFVPGGSANAAAQVGEGNVGHEGDDAPSNNIPSPLVGRGSAKKRPGKRPAAHGASPNEKKEKKTYRDGLMKRLVDAYKKKSESSKNSASATSIVVDHVRDKISQLMELVIQSGAKKGSDEHYYATQILIKKEYCDMFMTLKTPSERLAWLKRTWENKKKR